MRRASCILFAALSASVWCWGQSPTFSERHGETVSPASSSSSLSSPGSSISLTVPSGTPIKVALDKDVRIQKVGQAVQGRVVEPVYAFDKLLVPAGSEVIGEVTEIARVSKKNRTLSAMNGDFSPPHQVRIDFRELVLGDGSHVALKTTVTPGSNRVLQFVPANAEQQNAAKNRGNNVASREAGEVRQEIKREWDNARKQLHEPGKRHRLKRLALAQSPYHPQYIDSGTSFNAVLQRPLDFGSEALRPQALIAIGDSPPSGSVVHALLITPLNSATTKKNDLVEAIISQPLFVSDRLFIPQGSHLTGSVLQVRPARRLGRNGQLRIVFHQVVPPFGIERPVEASLEGVEVAKGEHLSLDSEGGAQVTTPKTRYLTTAVSVMLASASVSGDHDRDLHGGNGGDVGGGAANGASGFRFLGSIVGALAHSRVVTSGLGFYGASVSVYTHFLARGRDVVYPKDMSMLIGMGTRARKP